MRPPQHRYYGSGYAYGADHSSRRRMYGSSLVETTIATPPQRQQQWQHQQHQQQGNNSSGSSTIACRLCDQIFSSTQDLIRHVESHMSDTTRHHHKSSMPFSSPSHPLSRRDESPSTSSCNPSRFPSRTINNTLSFSQRPPLWSSPPATLCSLAPAAPPPPCAEGGTSCPDPAVWPHLSQGVQKNGPPSPVKANTTTTETNDLTMPFIRQLEQPLNPHLFRFTNGGGGYMDGFELLDLTLKL